MQAVIFDLDGTLVNTRERTFWQFEELTRFFDGTPASREEIMRHMHGTTNEVLRALVKNPNITDAQLRSKYDELYDPSLERLELYASVEELLPILRRLRYRLAAVTTSDDSRILLGLEKLGIRKYFDVIVTSEHITQPKPHPEGLLHVLTSFGLPPQEAAVVGDTALDVQTGKKALLAKTIAVSHGVDELPELRDAEPDHVINDIPTLLGVLEARVEK